MLWEFMLPRGKIRFFFLGNTLISSVAPPSGWNLCAACHEIYWALKSMKPFLTPNCSKSSSFGHKVSQKSYRRTWIKFSWLTGMFHWHSAKQYSKLNIDQGQFLWETEIHHLQNIERWLRILCSQFSLISRWHIFFSTTSTVASISNGNRFPWQWQVIQLLPPGPVGKIPLMHPENIPVKESPPATWAWMKRLQNYVHTMGNSPWLTNGMKACSSNTDSIPCDVSVRYHT